MLKEIFHTKNVKKIEEIFFKNISIAHSLAGRDNLCGNIGDIMPVMMSGKCRTRQRGQFPWETYLRHPWKKSCSGKLVRYGHETVVEHCNKLHDQDGGKYCQRNKTKRTEGNKSKLNNEPQNINK